MLYDILLKAGKLVNYATNTEAYCDIAIKDGIIQLIAPEISPSKAAEVFDLTGKIVFSGIIDPHVHLASEYGGARGHIMLARAGVTTALDMAGLVEDVFEIATKNGAGLNIACLNQIKPNLTVNNSNPSATELQLLLRKTLESGGIGLKILGGHYPLTPQSISDAIDICEQELAYIAFHAGSTNSGSNIKGALEAISLAANKRLHLAHANSYCRGAIYDCLEESNLLIQALKANANIKSESYLSAMNGTSAFIENDEIASEVTKNCLKAGGYPLSRTGMQQAIFDGWANINMLTADAVILASGTKAIEYWQNNPHATVSFPVNPLTSRLAMATAKKDNNEFVVDCISTDGGGIPRNEILSTGLRLVELGAFTLKEFNKKTSYNPAKMLYLKNKGSIQEGYDADITVVDPQEKVAYLTIVNGCLNMYRGYILKKSSTIVTSAYGLKHLQQYNVKTTLINIE